MMTSVKEMSEQQRRRCQADIGLVAQHRASLPPNDSRRKPNEMEQSQNTPHTQPKAAQNTVAQQTVQNFIDQMGRMAEPPTFKQVAQHELKRAAVWMPMLITTAVGLMWLQKKYFFVVFVPDTVP